MADPAEAERATGYVVGGISPLGIAARPPGRSWTRHALEHETVFVSAGRRGLQVELRSGDWCVSANARWARVARDGEPA